MTLFFGSLSKGCHYTPLLGRPPSPSSSHHLLSEQHFLGQELPDTRRHLQVWTGILHRSLWATDRTLHLCNGKEVTRNLCLYDAKRFKILFSSETWSTSKHRNCKKSTANRLMEFEREVESHKQKERFTRRRREASDKELKHHRIQDPLVGERYFICYGWGCEERHMPMWMSWVLGSKETRWFLHFDFRLTTKLTRYWNSMDRAFCSLFNPDKLKLKNPWFLFT